MVLTVRARCPPSRLLFVRRRAVDAQPRAHLLPLVADGFAAVTVLAMRQASRRRAPSCQHVLDFFRLSSLCHINHVHVAFPFSRPLAASVRPCPVWPGVRTSLPAVPKTLPCLGRRALHIKLLAAPTLLRRWIPRRRYPGEGHGVLLARLSPFLCRGNALQALACVCAIQR